MSTTPANRASRALRRTIALGGLGAFLAVVGGPSCAEIQSSTPVASAPTPKPPSRTNHPDLSSDDYFDQVLAIDSPASNPAAAQASSASPQTGDSQRILTPNSNAQPQLVSVTNVVAPASTSQNTSDPAARRNWLELIQTATATSAAPNAAAYNSSNPAAPATVVSVNPTHPKSNAKPAPATPEVAHAKPVAPAPISTTKQPEEESAPPIAAATTKPNTHSATKPTTTEPIEVATKPAPVEPAHTSPKHDAEPTSIAAAKPDATKPSDPKSNDPTPPVPATAAVAPTTPVTHAAATVPPVLQPVPRMPTPSFGLFTLTMQLAALAALMTTGMLAFFFSKTTDRAGVTARSLNLRTRFILAFGGLATICIVACAFASMQVTALAGVITLAACAAGSVASAIVICLWLERSTAQPIARINRAIRALATGDMLQKPINSSVRDEVGDLARSVDRLSCTMRDALTELAISSSEVSGAANQIVSGVKDMTTAATDVAKQCAEASRAAAEVSRDATDGHGAIKQTADGISALGQIASSHAAGMQSIQSRSQQVADLVKVIDALAERTNLVALNASVEASRSGPGSRAFAQLADEARKLSEQAQSAAAEAAQTVESLSSEARAACDKVSGSESQIRQGAAVASKASSDYETISSRTFTVAGVMQKAGLTAEGFGATAAQSEAAATQLATRSSHMMTVMKRFRLDTSKLVPVNNRSSGQPVEAAPAAV